MSDDTSDELAWRAEMTADLTSGDTTRSANALLELTYDEPDRGWLEDLLLDQLKPGNDPQLRALAVTCMGHVGRLHRAVSGWIVARLEGLLGDPELDGFAENALGDIRHFATIV